MNVVHLIEACATGTLSMVSLFANTQKAKGNKVFVIYSDRTETPKDLRNMFDDGINLYPLGMGAKSFPFSVFELQCLLKRINPDIVHCHSSFAGFVGRLASIRKQYQVFYSPHCISFMRKDIGWLKQQLFRVFELIANVRTSTYIACSESEKLSIEQALPFVNVKLLENAVDLSDYQHGVGEYLSSKRTIVTVGGIRPQKGPEEFAEIARQCKQDDCEFVWIGDGDSQGRELLQQVGVIVKGWMPKKDVISYLQQADLYISTARWEGMPVSVIEAIAANLPVIARKCAGNVDVIEHDVNGSLFTETVEAIALVKQWLSEPKPFKERSDIAFQEVFDRFSIERFSCELATIYQNK